ncbi:MAG: XRE family transcriptional regulator [Candidatus Acidulodesulfobacterium acidiphilum]|uniref:XRE family transcriptional regulator n=1 Tax=Candidatus Acidulodesulfobacterium acidiphilum TaxID=2597224 RepID=A0A520XDF9_9DELT|nr:MAG: XRE family transcriptional regulator [Candidatus Acidulodesulfobacterium acidiphilum]
MPKHKNIELFKHIGFKIRIKRRELNLSQEKLAEMLNVAYTQVYNYETGRFKIPLDYLLELADIFNVDLNYFLSDFNSGKKVKLENENLDLNKTIGMVKEIYNLNDENLIYLLKKSVESIYNIVKAKN